MSKSKSQLRRPSGDYMWHPERKQSKVYKHKAVIDEIINTEITYVEKLGIGLAECHDEFNDPMLQPIIPPPLREKNDILFANYEDIYHFHLNVFQTELLESADDLKKFAKCFIKRKEELIYLYSVYCRQRPEANEIMERLNQKYSDFLDKYQTRLKKKMEQRFGGNQDATLASFLVLPVQRCMKYRLLLQALLDKTSKDGFQRESELLRTATQCMDEVLETVNTSMPKMKKSSDKKPKSPVKKLFDGNNETPKPNIKVQMLALDQAVKLDIQSLQHKKRGCNVFGVELYTLCMSTSSQVPYVVRALTEDIEKRFNKTKNLYVSKEDVPSFKVDCLRVKFEVNYRKKQDVDMSSETNPQVLCTTLKQYFDELPTSLIPGHIYRDMINIAMEEHYSQDKRTAITALTDTLAAFLNHGPYTRTLNLLLRHLQEVSNKNTSVEDLARVWSRILFRDPKAQFPLTAGSFDHGLLTRILELLIVHRKNILWRGIKGVTTQNYKSGFLGSDTYLGKHEDKQKYFCVPFVHVYKQAANVRRGWIFMHFDGQKVIRQLELHPGMKPVMLFAGKHDDALCQLSLKESNLLNKHNAEISSWDFNSTWRKYNGDPFYLGVWDV